MAQFKRPLSESSSEGERSQLARPTTRRPNVYDAVAGKVTQSGFLGTKAIEQRRQRPLRPDEVLFKKLNAPIRYEETDYYFAHRNLPEDQKLPNGELLSALHAYVSKLYSRTQEAGDQKAWKCMDETALIALGILMEETAKGVLGETGDFALVQATRSDEEDALVDDEGAQIATSSGQESEGLSEPGEDSTTNTSSSDSGSGYSSRLQE